MPKPVTLRLTPRQLQWVVSMLDNETDYFHKSLAEGDRTQEDKVMLQDLANIQAQIESQLDPG